MDGRVCQLAEVGGARSDSHICGFSIKLMHWFVAPGKRESYPQVTPTGIRSWGRWLRLGRRGGRFESFIPDGMHTNGTSKDGVLNGFVVRMLYNALS